MSDIEIPMLNLQNLEKESELIWMVSNIRLPKGLEWSFEDRPWQIDIIEDKSKHIIVRKPTQIGMSTVFLGKMLYFADMHQCRLMYTLPRQDDVTDMVYSRLQEVITESPYIAERMGDVDNVRMKKFGKSFIHFAEMSVPPRMMDVDWMLNDEVDISNTEHLEQAAARMDASKLAYRHQISTPTIDNYGIDALFQLSDQKYWVITCAYCSHDQIMDWGENVIFDKQEAHYVCSRCRGPIRPDDIREGRWVATGNTKSDLSGYQISHLLVPYLTPNKLWIESKTMTPKNFYNLRLGLPFTPTSGSITKDMLINNCLNTEHDKELIATTKGAKYVIGADQGNVITFSVGRIDENGAVNIVLLGEIPFEDGFEELRKIMQRFGIRRGVVDALPNHHSATKLAEPYAGRVLVAYFSSINEIYRVQDETKLHVNKTDGYDALLGAIVGGRIQFYKTGNRIDEWTDRAMSHLSNMRRDVVQNLNKATGKTTTHQWKNTGPDHFADAILYMLLAAELATQDQIGLSVIDLSDPMLASRFQAEAWLGDDEFFDPDHEQEVIRERGFAMDIKSESPFRSKNDFLVPDNPYKLMRQNFMGYYDDIIEGQG